MRVLLAADGSEYTRRAALHLVQHAGWFAKSPDVHILHVHPALPLRGAGAVVGKSAIEKYYREESEEALAVAEKVLRDGGLKFHSSWEVGEVAEKIAAYAKENGIDLVVMGSHGHGALKGLVLGSVANKVLAGVKTPVMIVR